MKSRGSAMVIAFFLMTAVGGVAFGIGRIFVLDSAISSLYENGTVAYYAAESGIEEGLLRYRFDQAYQLPDGSTNVERFNLSDSALNRSNIDPVTNLISNPSKKFYDLNVVNRAEYYGHDANDNGYIDDHDLQQSDYSQGENRVFHIARDESVKIDISGINGTTRDLLLWLRMSNFAGQPNPAHNKADYSFVEAKITGTTLDGQFAEYKKALAKLPNYLAISDEGSIAELVAEGLGGGNYTRYNLISSIAGSRINNAAKAELMLKPIGCDIDIALTLNPRNDGETIISPYTTVKSVGYYGDATRTLTAKIDRQSGTVYDLFDFVVYKHN